MKNSKTTATMLTKHEKTRKLLPQISTMQSHDWKNSNIAATMITKHKKLENCSHKILSHSIKMHWAHETWHIMDTKHTLGWTRNISWVWLGFLMSSGHDIYDDWLLSSKPRWHSWKSFEGCFWLYKGLGFNPLWGSFYTSENTWLVSKISEF